jgi:uncharacterized protein
MGLGFAPPRYRVEMFKDLPASPGVTHLRSLSSRVTPWFAPLLGLLFVSMIPVEAQAQSFDCRKDRNADERAICAYWELAELDIRMSNEYFLLLNSLTGSTRARLQSQQREWLSERRDCGSNFRCLQRVYNERISELEAYATAPPAIPRRW